MNMDKFHKCLSETIRCLQEQNAIMSCALIQIADVKILAPLGSDPYKFLQTIARDALKDCNHLTEKPQRSEAETERTEAGFLEGGD